MSDDDEPRVVGPGFHEKVRDVVQDIPSGHVTTYGDIAGALGSRRVARHVGWALSRLGEEVPWHRVINGRGCISHRGDVARAQLQRQRLEDEGVVFESNGSVDLARWRWPLLSV